MSKSHGKVTRKSTCEPVVETGSGALKSTGKILLCETHSLQQRIPETPVHALFVTMLVSESSRAVERLATIPEHDFLITSH